MLSNIIVATSVEESDVPIADFCKKFGVECYRGHLSNVASRFKEVIEKYNLDGFVRLNGDSPLLDYTLVDKAVDVLRRSEFDIVTNVEKRTFPKGQSVEAVRKDAFIRAYELMKDADDLEHVTRFFYKNPAQFKISNFTSDKDYSAVHLSVDTQEDMKVIESIISKMDKPHWEYRVKDMVDIYRNVAKVGGLRRL